MRSRVLLVVGSALGGGLLGYSWDWLGIGRLYKSFVALFANPAAPLVGVSAAILFAFIIGLPRLCVP